ncbi:MAG: MASE1 domain-containing protein [Bradyrhizobium sp.]|jgi:PAS domain S-box-containing protein
MAHPAFLHKAPNETERPRASADQKSEWLKAIGLAAVVGLAYFLAARLSLSLLTKPDGVAVFWPANGVAVGVLIALGRGARWPVAAGAAAATMVANLLGDRTFVIAAISALCNVGEAIIAAGLIQRQFGSGFSLDRLRNVLGFLAAAALAAAISGVGGTLGFKLFRGSTPSILTTWEHWFASDAIGIVTLAPLVIGIAAAARDPPPPREILEGTAGLAAIALMSAIIIFLPRQSWETVLPIALVFPLLLALAARCQPVFAAAAAFIIALTIVWTTTFDIGYFGDPGLPFNERIEDAQASILTTSLCALVLAALFAERHRHEIALSEGAARLEEALEAGGVMAFEWDGRTGSFHHSKNAEKILGYEPLAPITVANFRKLIHPDDFAQYAANLRSVRPDKPSYTVAFRIIHPGAREMWLEERATVDFDAAGQSVRIRGLTVDITERKRADEHQRLLIAELDHRVKNVLARVATVAEYTRQSSSTMDEFIQAIDGRIQSMAVAHELLSRGAWRPIRLADIVRSQLAPYTTDANTLTGGPDTTLSAAATEALAMVFQELVTNASKYGALSMPGGQVSVRWECESSDAKTGVRIVWREAGGPPVSLPAKESYGTSLIRELIPHELGGEVDLSFSPGGVSCIIRIPTEEVSYDRTKDQLIDPIAQQ